MRQSKIYHCISIHSARVGGDQDKRTKDWIKIKFQSTPPVWAETARVAQSQSLL